MNESTKVALTKAGAERQDVGLYVIPHTGVAIDFGNPDPELQGSVVVTIPKDDAHKWIPKLLALTTPIALTDEEREALDTTISMLNNDMSLLDSDDKKRLDVLCNLLTRSEGAPPEPSLTRDERLARVTALEGTYAHVPRAPEDEPLTDAQLARVREAVREVMFYQAPQLMVDVDGIEHAVYTRLRGDV